MDHFKILKRAWEIVWKYRALWLVGLLLVLVGGGVSAGLRGSFPSGGGSGSGGSGSGGDGGGLQGPQVDWEQVMPILVIVGLVVLAIILVSIVFSLIKLVLRFMARSALIEMVNGYEEREEKLGFWAALRSSWKRSTLNLFLTHFLLTLPMFLLGLTIALVVMAVVLLIIVMIVPAAMSGTPGAAAPLILIAVLGFILIVVVSVVLGVVGLVLNAVISLIREIADRLCILNGQTPIQAIKEAIALIRRNLSPAALQYLLMWGLSIAWGIVLAIFNLPLVFVALFIAGPLALAVGGLVGLIGGVGGGILSGILVFIPTLIVIVALPNIILETFATVYHSTAWTLAFRELCALDEGPAMQSVEFKIAD